MAFRWYLAFLAFTCAQALNLYQNGYGNLPNNQGFRIPQITMPSMKPIVFPAFPTFPTFSPQDIINQQVGPGVNFNGVALSSVSFTNVDQDGKVRRGGGTKIITNHNGVIKEETFPDGVSNVNIVSSFSPMIPKVPFVPLQPVPKIDPIIVTKSKPGQFEDFRGKSIVSYRHETNINGERSAGGVDTIISNDNGRLDKKTYKYGDLNDA